ncbi:hypothetical protein V5O48_016575 [Marasmius crinis-equi]|uniref:Uncharacterized protein n=1 Tax=Marasmius crinis-equi TaxID=585013 RepID=A0ABR3ERH3_9AGAR
MQWLWNPEVNSWIGDSLNPIEVASDGEEAEEGAAPLSEPEVIEVLDSKEPVNVTHLQATVEEVEDKDSFIPCRTLDPDVEYILEEDGYDDLPEETFYSSSDPDDDPAESHPCRLVKKILKKDVVDGCIKKLNNILHPQRSKGRGFKKLPEMNGVLKLRLELMLWFLRLYAGQNYTNWTLAADLIATSAGKGPWLSRMLRVWTIDFAEDEENLPEARYGWANVSILEDKDIVQELHLHLQGIGKYVAAKHIVQFLDLLEVRAWFQLKKGIKECQAQRWMKRMW